jgi:hypothetical protein
MLSFKHTADVWPSIDLCSPTVGFRSFLVSSHVTLCYALLCYIMMIEGIIMLGPS